MICPICGFHAEAEQCTVCGFDRSTDRELYPTLAITGAVSASKAAISRQRYSGLQQRLETLELRVADLESGLQDLTERLEILTVQGVSSAAAVTAEMDLPSIPILPGAGAEQKADEQSSGAAAEEQAVQLPPIPSVKPDTKPLTGQEKQ